MATPRMQFPDIEVPEVAPSAGAASTAIMQLAQMVNQDSLRRDAMGLERVRLEGEQRRQEFDQVLQLREQQTKDRQMEIQQAAQALQMTAQLEMQAVQLQAAQEQLEYTREQRLREQANRKASDALTPKVQELDIMSKSGDVLGAALAGKSLQRDPNLRVASDADRAIIAEATGATMKHPVGPNGETVADAMRIADSSKGNARNEALAQLASVSSDLSLARLRQEYKVTDEADWKEVLRIRDTKYGPEAQRRLAEFYRDNGELIRQHRQEAMDAELRGEYGALAEFEHKLGIARGVSVNQDPDADPLGKKPSMEWISSKLDTLEAVMFGASKNRRFGPAATASIAGVEQHPVLGTVVGTKDRDGALRGVTSSESGITAESDPKVRALREQWDTDRGYFNALVSAIRSNNIRGMTEETVAAGLLAAGRITYASRNPLLNMPALTLSDAVGGGAAIKAFNATLERNGMLTPTTRVPGALAVPAAPQQPQAAKGSTM